MGRQSFLTCRPNNPLTTVVLSARVVKARIVRATEMKTSNRARISEKAKPKYGAAAKVAKPAKKTNTIQKSPILQAVHESAADLYSIGLISKTTMRQFDSLCLPKVPNYTATQIKAIRNRYHASQAVFAMYMNITVSALQKWEVGAKKPSGPALKLLNLIDKKGLEFLIT